jgi:hypothetical protein
MGWNKMGRLPNFREGQLSCTKLWNWTNLKFQGKLVSPNSMVQHPIYGNVTEIAQ